VYPTISVVVGAFHDDKNQWNSKVFMGLLKDSISRHAFLNSIQISAWTAISGAIIGGLFAWTLATSKEGSFFYKISVALSSVLAQFGGVMLTFAFLATFGFNGVISNLAVKHAPNLFLANSAWLYTLGGLGVVYTFFQIPLMVIVFLPTIQNMKPQWRESSDALGGNSLEYWIKVGLPILTPSFFGAALLLFVNSFSAYATAATLVNISSLLTTLQIATALQSEVGGANPTEAKALSLFMVAVVTLAMILYSMLRKRVSKWEKQ
jgi:putative spermidine/putrescine transport system permease protein